MTRRMHVEVEIDAYVGAVPVFHVAGWRGCDLWLLRDDDARFRPLWPLRQVETPVPDGTDADGWPSLPALLRREFPDLLTRAPSGARISRNGG